MYVIWKISLAFFFPRQREPGDSLRREKCYCSWCSKLGSTSVFQWPLEDLDSSWMSVWFQVHLDWGITCHYNNSRGQLCFMTKKEKSFSASNCEFFLPALLLPGFHCIDFNHTSSEASLFQAGKSHCVQLLTLICFPPYFHLTYVASDGETQDQKHLLLSPPAAELQGLKGFYSLLIWTWVHTCVPPEKRPSQYYFSMLSSQLHWIVGLWRPGTVESCSPF